MTTGTLKGLFITGTDTGVGKTRVGTELVKALCKNGVRVRVRKPVESGCGRQQGRLIPEDALALMAAAGHIDSQDQVCRYPLAAALSPERAATLAGVTLSAHDLAAACRDGLADGDFLLVEGAGGFYSPIAAAARNAELAAELGLPVLLVAADRLGAINHTLLTVEAIERAGLALAAVVLNRFLDNLDPQMDNHGELTRWLGRPVIPTYPQHLPVPGRPPFAALAPLAAALAATG